jgi:murein tripeptide amidase MpaA
MHIHSTFDSGAIEVVSATDPNAIQLRLQEDPPTDTPDGVKRFAQWFHFRVDGVRDVPLRLSLDTRRSSYPDGWKDYRVVASYDRETWFRVDTTYNGDNLVFTHTPCADAVWFAYFAPYDLTRHAALIGRAASDPDVRLRPVGTTLDGRSIDRLIVGEPGEGKRVLWLIARQHPGESMAEWWMEGFLDRLLDPNDTLARVLRSKAVLHVIPNMNPDGSFRGHLRTNAAGANLNREWATPTLAKSPEVLHTLAAMDDTGVDFCLDVHGDEALPYNFVSGAEGVPRWDARMASLQQRFLDAYELADPSFQQVYGYPIDKPGEGNLTMATNQIAERYGCLSMTLEQPFKDDANHPHARGWSPERAKRLGASVLHPILAVLADLRDQTP